MFDKDGRVAVNPLGIALDGCPLGEKISEMHTLRKAGDPVGALALFVVDSPVCPGTGHRICNDCRHRQHHLADAVHDEGSLRAVPAEARRSENRSGNDHLSLLQPGSEHGRVDFPNLAVRLRQNTVQEKLSNLWLDYLLSTR